MKCLEKAIHDPSRRERCDLWRHAWTAIGDNSPLTDRSYRTLRDGHLDRTFQAFHAWLPSSVPPGQTALDGALTP